MSVRPPNQPWIPLPVVNRPIAALSYYYSDKLSRLPVRAVTLPRNNKSDPNLETATYGMFSTCESQMRLGVRARNLSHIVFLTNIQGKGRFLTGYYELGWYCQSPFSTDVPDYCLAARRVHFVANPVAVGSTPRALRLLATARFRTFRYLTEAATEDAINILDEQPNSVDSYISEIKRLERINVTHVGEPYIGWGVDSEGFNWKLAKQYLISEEREREVSAVAANNVARDDIWRCNQCGYKLVNKARLKRCSSCGSIGTFIPSEE